MVLAGSSDVPGRVAKRGISEASLQLLDVFEIPLFLFTAEAAVAWLNKPARRLLERLKIDLDAGGVVRSDGLLSRRVESFRSCLRDAFGRTQDDKGGWTAIALPGLPNTRLHLCRLVLHGAPFVACVPTQNRRSNRLPPRLSAYGLTATEKKIAGQLIKGRSISEIASRNGNAVLTVRTHIKHIYSKIGVSNRGQMFAHLLG